MTEEQKVQVDLLKTLFLDGVISAAEFEKRKEAVLKEPLEEIIVKEPKPDQQPAPAQVVAPKNDVLGFWIVTTAIVAVLIIILYSSSKNKREEPKSAIEEFKELTPYQQDSILKHNRDLAKIDSAILAKREKEERAKELAEEKAFLKTKAGKIWNKHRDWSKEDCALLAQGKYWVGMHIDMLKYRRGLPDSANPSNYGNGTSWQWCWHDYTPSCFYDNNNDGLIDAYN